MAGPKILIIDDNDVFVNYLKALLEGDFPNIVRASDGEIGLGMAKSEAPNIILLDMIMPKMNGLEVAQALQEAPETLKIPILILTGTDFDATTQELLREQPNVRACLSKTCGPKTIIDLVAQTLAPAA